MAAKGETPQGQIECIKANLRSTSTCTAATVDELRRILADQDEDPHQKENSRTKGSRYLSSQQPSRKKTVASQKPATLITPRERYILATEVANVTLKCLADSLKLQAKLPNQPTRPKSRANDNIKTQPTVRSRKAPHVQKPLQERSASQAHNSPSKPTLRRSLSYSSCLTTGPDPGLIAMAESSRAAFSYLRTAEAVKIAGKDSPPLQLENGSLALVGKLVGLSLDNLAVKELRVLKKRLDMLLQANTEAKQRKTPAGPSAAGKRQVSEEKESLASLLNFGEIDRSSPILPSIISHQTYTLRVLSRIKRPRVVEEAWDYVKLSNPNAPANLILHVATNTKVDAKVARQLESLSQTLLSMCPSISSSEDPTTGQEQLQPSPDIVFSFQQLAFKIRQKWWALAKHQVDLEKELVEPFSRCLIAFSRRSKTPRAEKYKTAELLYGDLFSEEFLDLDKRTTTSSGIVISKCLSSLAQAAGNIDVALRWLENCESTKLSKCSAAVTALRLVRTTALSIDAVLKGKPKPDLDQIVAQGLDALSGDLDGSSTELDSLFMEANGLRRIATKCLLPNSPKIDNTLHLHMLPIITACVHFSARYIRSRTSKDDTAKERARRQDRINLVGKSVKSIVDSLCVTSKTAIQGDSQTHWTHLDGLFQDCVSILHEFEELSEDFPDDLQLPFVKVSNAYWAVHVQLKVVSDTDATIMAMQRSVEQLRTRTKPEQQSGLMTMKLERLGEALDDAGRTRDSRNVFLECIHVLNQSEDLQRHLTSIAKFPVDQVIGNQGPASELGRVIKSYQRSFLRSGLGRAEDFALFDDHELSAANRGMLLEWQLSLFLKTLSRNRAWDSDLNATILEIITRCMALYTPTKYPIRRLRLQTLCFRLSQELPEVITSNLLPSTKETESYPGINGTEDEGLARYEKYFKGLVRLKSLLQEAYPSPATFQECFSSWQSIINSVSSWEALQDHTDNADHWIEELQMIADFLAAKGEEYTRAPVLNLLVKLLELQPNVNISRLLTSIGALGMNLLRMGYSGKAGLVFAKGEPLVSNKSTSTEAKLNWHLGYAEYLLRIGNSDKCEGTLLAAEKLARGDPQFLSLSDSGKTLFDRLRYNRILADACFMYSLLSSSNGYHKDAARFAKQSVALNRRIWSALESRSLSRKATQNEGDEVGQNGDSLSSMRNEQGVLLVTSNTHESLDGPAFWPLVPCLYHSLMQQSLVFAHQGLFHEAMYSAEQAEKVVRATRANSLAIENCATRANYWAHSGRPDKARTAFESLDPVAHKKQLFMTAYYSSMALIHHTAGEFDRELETYETLEQLFTELTLPSFIKSVDSFLPPVDAMAEQLSRLTLNKQETQVKPTTKPIRGRKPAARTTVKPQSRKAVRPVEPQLSNIVDECAPLFSARADILRHKALANIAHDDVSRALSILKEVQKFDKSQGLNNLHLWASFKALFSQGMAELAKDFTFNALPESTIGFPSLDQKEINISSTQPARRRRGPAKPITKSSTVTNATDGEFVKILQEARERLVGLQLLCVQASSTSTFKQVSSALGHLIVLLSALTGSDQQGSSHPLYAAYMNEVPKYNALKHAQDSIEIEKETPSREGFLRWPELDARNRFTVGSAAEFQRDYVDIIPKSWIAVSLALNENQDELYITRYESGLSPFILRLPMARHTCRDMDEEEFTFDDGQKSFEEIIELSDFSTRSAKDMTTKNARQQWWAEREALDSRLHELLVNIENIWLGGFRGIFSKAPAQPTALARFRKSFELTLNRHLPSRRGKSQQNKASLDTRVLELFVALGDATNDELDLDEALQDLVYFVVDILQFNGERNAYDEIDFDAIVIETLDALRAYHNACQSATPNASHTILILDGNLHVFPWESLPSLQSVSMSRLPSLAALRERILAAQPPRTTKDARPGHYISALVGGTSILNPSGDLAHTVKTIKPRLDHLQGDWSHIVGRAPSDQEFEHALREKELVLYFGHGSGAQYVRSKSVRRLYSGTEGDYKRSGCATTFLFGCSSVHMSNNGIYEPSGMLTSYLTAGAPAVIGMLWDVTDKDCDRFAVRTGELWGLWPEVKGETDAPKTGKKGKGKGKVAQLVAEVECARRSETDARSENSSQSSEDSDHRECTDLPSGRGAGLDEAVREARKACVLRYLNGAAAVVYGIPVFLE